MYPRTHQLLSKLETNDPNKTVNFLGITNKNSLNQLKHHYLVKGLTLFCRLGNWVVSWTFDVEPPDVLDALDVSEWLFQIGLNTNERLKKWTQVNIQHIKIKRFAHPYWPYNSALNLGYRLVKICEQRFNWPWGLAKNKLMCVRNCTNKITHKKNQNYALKIDCKKSP